MKGTSEPEGVIDPIPADFLKQDVLDLPNALLLGGFKESYFAPQICPICGTLVESKVARSCDACSYDFQWIGGHESNEQQHLVVRHDGQPFLREAPWLVQMLEMGANFMRDASIIQGGIQEAAHKSLLEPEFKDIFLKNQSLKYFLADFTMRLALMEPDEIPILTPARLQGVLNNLCLESDDNSLVNFSLFWNLWKYKLKTTKKGSVSSEKFLRTWFDKNLEAGAIFDPESNQLYLIKNTERAQYYSFPIHWRTVKINTGNRLRENPKTDDVERMFSLYRRYVRGLASSLSFVRCASKLTRLGKLYTKPLEFTMDSEMYSVLKRLQKLEQMEVNSTREVKKNPSQVDMAVEYGLIQLRNERRELQHRLSLLERDVENIPPSLRNLFEEKRKMAPKRKWRWFENLTNLPPQETINQRQIIHHHLEANASFKPLLISGDAGKGKTISISYFALEYVQTLEDLIEDSTPYDMKTLQMPMFFRAKRLTTVLRKFKSSNNLLPVLWNGLLSTSPDIIHHIDEAEFAELMHLWDEFQSDHDSSLIVFLDGMDECDSDASASEVMNLFNTSVFNTGKSIRTGKEPMLILSSRPSRLSLIQQTIPTFAIADMSADGYFSEHELSIEMPLRLCDAWGVTRESGEKLSEVFDKHRDTLIHPLFVGWFCFLIYDGRLDQIESSSNEPQILQNNLISQIIEIGIASSLESRESRYTDMAEAMPDQKFVEILRSFVSVSYHFKITEPRLVREKMGLLGLESNYPNDLWDSILHDCGILYLTGEQIEWTHKVVFEIMYADFYHANHVDLALGPLNVSDPVLSRLAQIQVESKQATTYDCAKLRLLFRYKPDEFMEMAKEIWQGSSQSSHGDPLITLDKGKSLIPIRTDRSELEIELASLFIASMDSPHRFAMHWELFDNEHWEQIIGIVMESAETPYARDLISFHRSEAPIPPHHIRFGRLTSNDDISYCFALYRRVLMSKFGPGLDTDHPLFKVHRRVGGLRDLFNIEHVNQNYPGDFPLTSWFSNRFRTKSFDFPDDERFSQERDELIDYVTREYVFAAYDLLFGEDLSESCIDVLWEQTYGTIVTVIKNITAGESENKEIVGLCLEQMGHWDFDEPERFQLDETVVRGLLLMPFVHYCLSYHLDSSKGMSGLVNPLLKVNQFHTVFKQPYDLIKRFSANMDQESD